ncbi:MAG: PPC domain-containing protein [Sandaracinaceae bacterium]
MPSAAVRRLSSRSLIAVAALLAVGVGCDTGVTRRDGSILGNPDAGAPPPPPEIDPPLPSVVAWPLITIRGNAPGARRVLVRGAANPTVREVLPDETFCVDVPIPMTQAYSLELLSHSASGLFSEPTTASIEFDPTAPPGAIIPTCNGSDPRGCMGATEICDNLRDDDCDSRVDDDDPDCSTCANDLLESNDELASAPRLPPGEYADLVVCPSDDDYYGFFLRMGQRLDVTIQFRQADADLDLELYDAAGALLDSSASVTDDEMVSYPAPADGEVVLRVFSPSASATATYTLLLTVSG